MDNPLVGRASERAAIHALLGDAERGVAGALLLTGPAGIGKSALVRYAIDGGSGFRVVRVVGVESEMAFGYAAVHQLVLLLFDCVEGLPEPQRATLDGVLGKPMKAVLAMDDDGVGAAQQRIHLTDRCCLGDVLGRLAGHSSSK